MSASSSLRSKIVCYVYPKTDAQLEIGISSVISGFNVTFQLQGQAVNRALPESVCHLRT